MASQRPLSFLPLKLQEEILEYGQPFAVGAGDEILQAGQSIRFIPLLFSGLIKVYSSYEDRELLLYYIQPVESCIMSFSAVLENNPSKINAIALEPSEGMLLPSRHVQNWVNDYPPFARLFYREFAHRYDDLLQTIHDLLFESLDKRLLNYLREKSTLGGGSPLQLKHREIANDLGTAREVVSRLLKKLESEGVISQQPGQWIKIL